jgi:hypothetical protein
MMTREYIHPRSLGKAEPLADFILALAQLCSVVFLRGLGHR